MKTLVQMTDAEGRLALPPNFARSIVVVEVHDEEEKLVIRRASVQGITTDQFPTPAGGELVVKRRHRTAETTSTSRRVDARQIGEDDLPVTVSVQTSGRVLIDGYPLTRFLKALGLAEWSNRDASRLLVRLAERSGVHELRDIADKSTVSCQVGDGRKMRRGEEPSHAGGDPAPLSEQQLRALSILANGLSS